MRLLSKLLGLFNSCHGQFTGTKIFENASLFIYSPVLKFFFQNANFLNNSTNPE